jgi:hypothetical protein
MATLKNITLKAGGQSGKSICAATKGTSGVDHSIVALQGVQWSASDPADYLKKKVAVNATIERPQGDKSFAKIMYITRMSIRDATVGLSATEPS